MKRKVLFFGIGLVVGFLGTPIAVNFVNKFRNK